LVIAMETPMIAVDTPDEVAQWLHSVIANAERYARSTFEEPLIHGVVLSPSALTLQRKLFIRSLNNARMLFGQVRTAIEEWRQGTAKLQIKRDTTEENQLWELLSAWICLSEFLVSMVDLHYQNGTIICKNTLLRPILEKLEEAKQIRRTFDQLKDPIEEEYKSATAVLRQMVAGVKPRSSSRLDELAQKVAEQKTENEDEKAWAERLTKDLLDAGG